MGERLLLDVQQVIPLPEASELTIQLQRKATQERAVRGGDGRDWTQYVITRPTARASHCGRGTPSWPWSPHSRAAGVPAREIAQVIPPSKFLSVDGTLAGEELAEAFAHAYPKERPKRWFLDSPVHDEGRTWMVTKMWGTDTELVLQRLAGLAPPGSGIGYESVL